MRYRRDIEGLRAIAVVAVLLFHFGVPGVDGGFVGVDVFFVISGFLITSLLVDERTTNGHISIKGFYARRARRLLPISVTVLVVTSLAGALLLPATRLPNLATEVRAAGMFGANVLFAVRGTNYLTANLDPSPLRHYWSLAVEEQFYFVWPALIGLITYQVRRRNVRRRVAWAMGAIVVGSFLLSALFTSSSPSWSYFGLHTRAWELGLGALLAAVAPALERVPPAVRNAVGWVGLAGIGACVATFGSVTVFPGWIAVLPVLATAAVLAAVLAAGSSAWWSPGRLLGRQPLTYLGTRSYSLYLWHWPVLIIAEAHLARSLTFVEKVVAMAAVFAVAEAGYHWIEQPVRTNRRLAARPRWSLTMGGALVAAGLLTSVALGAYEPDLSTGVEAAAPAIDSTTTTVAVPVTDLATSTTVLTAPAAISMTDTPALQAIVDALTNEVVPDNLRPSLRSAAGDNPSIYGNGCHQFMGSGVRTDCVFGDPNGSITIALWGDSHAAEWFTTFESLAIARGWRLLSLTQGGCPFIDVNSYDSKNNVEYRHCGPWRKAVRQYMIDQHVDVVFMSEHYGLLSTDDHQSIGADEWQAHLPELLTGLRADGIEPVVIADSPNPPKVVPDCLATNRRHISACAATAGAGEAAAIDDVIRSVTSAADAGFIEPSKWVCADGSCPAVVGDILVYRDGNHLSNTMAAWLAPVVDALVGPFVEDYVRYRAAVG